MNMKRSTKRNTIILAAVIGGGLLVVLLCNLFGGPSSSNIDNQLPQPSGALGAGN